MSNPRRAPAAASHPALESGLVEGLADAGLQAREIEAFLAYSRAIERELGPVATPALPRAQRAPWFLLAVAATLLLAVGIGAAMLLGERGALAGQLERVRSERDALALQLRSTSDQRAHLQGELAALSTQMQRRIEDEARIRSEVVRYFQSRLLEQAAMGDPRVLSTAGLLSDVTRDLPARMRSGDFRDGWNQLVPPLDPFGFQPSAFDQLELASNWR